MRFLKVFSSLIISVLMLNLSSCTPEVCDDVVCANEGICSGGVCLCQEGYEGVRCESMSRDKFLGTYSVAENGTLSLPSNYSVNIHRTDAYGVSAVKLKGFYNSFEDQVYAICKGDSIMIPEQTLTDGSVVLGYGLFTQQDYYANHGSLTLSYKVTLPSGDVDDFGIDLGQSSEWSK